MPDISLRFHRDMLVVDGALATLLLQEDVPKDACIEHLNLLDPAYIESIHRRYLAVGADCITSNTFGASRAKLAAYGLEDQLVEINQTGIHLARNAGATHVLASVGPCGLTLDPADDTMASFEVAYLQYHEQITALAAAAPDAILIETMSDIADACCAASAAKAACKLPLFVSCSFETTGKMLCGTDAALAAWMLEDVGADVVGMNCVLEPEQMLPLIKQMAAVTKLPLIVQPSAGTAKLNARKNLVYSTSADDMARYAQEFKALGVQFIGSCSGTNPVYTGAIYAVVGDSDVVPRA